MFATSGDGDGGGSIILFVYYVYIFHKVYLVLPVSDLFRPYMGTNDVYKHTLNFLEMPHTNLFHFIRITAYQPLIKTKNKIKTLELNLPKNKSMNSKV